MAGMVFVDSQRVDKAGEKVSMEANIEYKGKALPYVSRGGLKARKSYEDLPNYFRGKSLYGYRCIYRWIYRLYASKWS